MDIEPLQIYKLNKWTRVKQLKSVYLLRGGVNHKDIN